MSSSCARFFSSHGISEYGFQTKESQHACRPRAPEKARLPPPPNDHAKQVSCGMPHGRNAEIRRLVRFSTALIFPRAVPQWPGRWSCRRLSYAQRANDMSPSWQLGHVGKGPDVFAKPRYFKRLRCPSVMCRFQPTEERAKYENQSAPHHILLISFSDKSKRIPETTRERRFLICFTVWNLASKALAPDRCSRLSPIQFEGAPRDIAYRFQTNCR